MTKYETVYVLDPSFDENKATEESDRVSTQITELGGTVVEVQKWGKRRLAYEINKKRDGVYTMIVWEGAGSMVKEIERRLRANENVMRVLTTMFVSPELTQGVPEGEAVAAGADSGDDE